MKTKIIGAQEFDASKYLSDEETILHYLRMAAEDGDDKTLRLAIGDVAKARGMTEVAKISGIKRESLYRSLSPTGNPEFSTVYKVAQALGFRMVFEVDPTAQSTSANVISGRRQNKPRRAPEPVSVPMAEVAARKRPTLKGTSRRQIELNESTPAPKKTTSAKRAAVKKSGRRLDTSVPA